MSLVEAKLENMMTKVIYYNDLSFHNLKCTMTIGNLCMGLSAKTMTSVWQLPMTVFLRSGYKKASIVFVRQSVFLPHLPSVYE